MNGPQLPVTPRVCDNVASPCSRCGNAGVEGSKDPVLCENCQEFKAWEEKECSSKN
jgi:hypothetical protein